MIAGTLPTLNGLPESMPLICKATSGALIPKYLLLWGSQSGNYFLITSYGGRSHGSIPRLGRSPRERNGYPLQYFCLDNSMDRRTMGSQRTGHHRAK